MNNNCKRPIYCFISMTLIMMLCCARVFTIATDSKIKEAAVNQSTRRYTVKNTRGTIYDCNGKPLTDSSKQQLTVVFPTEQGMVALSELAKGDEFEKYAAVLRSGSPVTINAPYMAGLDGAIGIDVPKRYGGTLSHIIGYTDGSGAGVTGIEKGFDSLLSEGSGISVSYKVTSTGRMVESDGWTVKNGTTDNSVTLTVDSSVQTIAEDAMSGVPAGAAVVIDVKSGKIRASVSRPDYDQNNVAAYLDSNGSPLINRALYSYNVGSVFKPCLAAASIETGNADYTYTCTGSIDAGGRTFRCNNSAGHGTLELGGALSLSCNTYFYTLGRTLGAETVYSFAKLFRFGEALPIGGGLISASGSMPSLDTLAVSEPSLINLSIGQGELLLSPVALSCMYMAIANGGEYFLPQIVEGVTEDGVYTPTEVPIPTRAMSAETAGTLKEYLKNALINGTGHSAFSDSVTAGGKTGTAQTGWKDGDRSILNGWFCGFFEGKTGSYVIVILKEDVKSGSADCAPVFKEISEKMVAAGY